MLGVTTTSELFNAGVEEKLVRDRTGHKSNALYKYEKGNEMNLAVVSKLFGPNLSQQRTESNSNNVTECAISTIED